MTDELQKKESNIDRQTVKIEDNHDHNNLVSYQCINILLNLPKYCVIEITTPVDCPRVSLVIIIMNKSQELTVFQGRQKLTSAKN